MSCVKVQANLYITVKFENIIVDKLKIYAINTNSCLRSTIKNYKDYFAILIVTCHFYNLNN